MVVDPAPDSSSLPDDSSSLPDDAGRPKGAPPSMWRNGAFVRVWTAGAISVFGSLITNLALPFTAILVLDAGPLEIAAIRGLGMVSALLVGFAAGAWVDRLRRRPVLIWADLGRAALLGSIPIAAYGGWLTLAQLLVVAAASAVLTTFFDLADHAYLPAIVDRADLVRANGALSAASSTAEFAGFGVAGFLIQALTAPIAIAIDAVTFLVSGLLLLSVRRPEPPPPPTADREPILDEIRAGLRVVAGDPSLRALIASAMGLAAMYGVAGATWLLFVTETLGLNPATIGIIAATGGIGSLAGSLAADRSVRRFGLGRVAVGSLLLAALGSLLTPLAPAGLPLVALGCLLGQQLIGDAGAVAYEISETSFRQGRVPARQLGRVNATVHVATVLAQLVATMLGGVIGATIGLRVSLFVAPLIAIVGVVILWASPLRTERTPSTDPVAG